MKTKIYNVLEAINKYGYDSSNWGVCEEVNTSWYFGTNHDEELTDKYIYIYVSENDLIHFRDGLMLSPEIILTTDQENTFIILYKM